MTEKKRSARVRRVAVVTGARAEYGLLRSTMEAIARRRGMRLQVVVTGMHLLRKFGRTVDDIERDGWRIDARVKMQSGRDEALDQAVGLSRGVAGMASYFEQADTDVAVVLGDRIEAMAGALAAVTTGRFLAHIHGGDVAPGDFDDPLRNAISKLAHLHLPATQRARKRLLAMGESEDRVHVVGAPGLDRLAQLIKSPSCRTPPQRRALIVQHPCGRSPAKEQRVMTALLRAVDETDLNSTIVYPNSDRGHTGIVAAIDAHRRSCSNGRVEVVRSLDRDAYLHRLMAAAVLVGNSSSGIIEAATAGTAVVNVGGRQAGRERSGPSIVDAGESRESIREALQKALRKRPIIGRETIYGDGGAGRRIAQQLARMPLSDGFRRKTARGARPREGPNLSQTS